MNFPRFNIELIILH